MGLDKAKLRALIRKNAGLESTADCPCCKVGLSPMTVEGVETDFCPDCHGVWLDSGEAADIAEGMNDFPDFEWSWSQRKESKKLSPRDPGVYLWELPYMKGKSLLVDFCQKSKGLWLDCSEIAELEGIIADQTDPNLRLNKLANELKKGGYIVLT
ncbi:MAG: zf-TFIIB domain-containing protein [Candidatus Cloacimonetes bacterium]|nr:zf-TFIIB domain-containing protein [Candidatus Cloacimonadota bacterium]